MEFGSLLIGKGKLGFACKRVSFHPPCRKARIRERTPVQHCVFEYDALPDSYRRKSDARVHGNTQLHPTSYVGFPQREESELSSYSGELEVIIPFPYQVYCFHEIKEPFTP